ncbi:hypothetical protein DVH26_19420 [Paenibacillus sp. H1-7]|nr:hypothetical protein DVH26_19420 [Paenibacillus sp. H1-7]
MRDYRAFYSSSEHCLKFLMIYPLESERDINGELQINELIFEKRPFIDEIPTIHCTSHPFNGFIKDREIILTFTGEAKEAKSLNPNWKDPMSGVIWKGALGSEEIVFSNETFNEPVYFRVLEDDEAYHRMLVDLGERLLSLNNHND